MSETLEGVSMEVPMTCDKGGDCRGCPLFGKAKNSHTRECVELIAAEVQRLRDERENNPGVWDKAPDDAAFCSVNYCKESGVPYDSHSKPSTYFYTRTLPKTIEQEIAEKYGKEKNIDHFIMAALQEYKERSK